MVSEFIPNVAETVTRVFGVPEVVEVFKNAGWSFRGNFWSF